MLFAASVAAPAASAVAVFDADVTSTLVLESANPLLQVVDVTFNIEVLLIQSGEATAASVPAPGGDLVLIAGALAAAIRWRSRRS